MDQDLKTAVDRFTVELRKDIWFFGGCGVVVALFMVWQARLKELGIANDSKWATDLFSDFVSFNAFGLIFFGYLFLGCIANVFFDFGRPLAKLEAAVNHMESRLTQIASSIVSFMAGLLLLVVIYSILNLDSGGFLLIAMSGLFSGFVFVTFVIALAVGRRTKPFEKWWVSALMFLCTTGTLGWLLIHGGK